MLSPKRWLTEYRILHVETRKHSLSSEMLKTVGKSQCLCLYKWTHSCDWVHWLTLRKQKSPDFHFLKQECKSILLAMQKSAQEIRKTPNEVSSSMSLFAWKKKEFWRSLVKNLKDFIKDISSFIFLNFF